MSASLKRRLLLPLALFALAACETRPIVLPPQMAPLSFAEARCPEGMVGVPGGQFAMGGTWAGARYGRAEAVTVQSFCIERSEVTVERYLACVKEGKCASEHLEASSPDGKLFIFDPHCNGIRKDRGDHPINCVDFSEAEAFCRAEEGRLPTEEEWEWVARGGQESADFPWQDTKRWDSGERYKRVCWMGEPNAPLDGTCAVGQFPKGDSSLGIHDLLGNVWEWTSSNHGTSSDRVLRGGSWMMRRRDVVSAHLRLGYPPAARESDVGFRCARDILPAPSINPTGAPGAPPPP